MGSISYQQTGLDCLDKDAKLSRLVLLFGLYERHLDAHVRGNVIAPPLFAMFDPFLYLIVIHYFKFYRVSNIPHRFDISFPLQS